MTLPDERRRSVNQTRDFLTDLMYPSKTPKVPRRIRDDARALLRHFPSDHELGGRYFEPLDFEKPIGPPQRTEGPVEMAED